MPRKDAKAHSATPSIVEHDQPSIADDQSERLLDQDHDSTTNETPGVIILHPGSSTLRLGLSTQLSPNTVPHLIAYRRERAWSQEQTITPTLASDIGLSLRCSTELTTELQSQRESGLEAIRDSVVEARAGNGVMDAESDIDQYAALNAQSLCEPCSEDDEVTSLFQWADTTTDPQFVIGNEALHLPADAHYQLYKPLRRAKLNVSPTISRTCVLNQLEDLWARAIEECLDIPRRDFKFYRAILLVPDLIDRTLLRDYMNLLLSRLGFEAALIQQESVCATYGAGLSTSCVIDVGEERTHVCCVEDGVSNPNTRLTVSFGGNSITKLFYYLLQRVNFPYKDCSEDSVLDFILLQQLKEKYCHFDMTVWGIAEEQLIVPYKGVGGVKYNVWFADELVYAPMGVFYPDTFSLHHNEQQLMAGQTTQNALLEDIFDETHWTSEQAQQSKAATVTGGGGEGGNGDLTEACRRLSSIPDGTIMSLDQAVNFCIDCSSTDEMRKKLYGSVLLIGGGLSYPGAATMLQHRLEASLSQLNKGVSSVVEVCSSPRDIDPGEVAWKGGAVLSVLDSCQELWIENQDWELFGVRILREKAAFVW